MEEWHEGSISVYDTRQQQAKEKGRKKKRHRMPTLTCPIQPHPRNYACEGHEQTSRAAMLPPPNPRPHEREREREREVWRKTPLEGCSKALITHHSDAQKSQMSIDFRRTGRLDRPENPQNIK
jgi:hypothetical protein